MEGWGGLVAGRVWEGRNKANSSQLSCSLSWCWTEHGFWLTEEIQKCWKYLYCRIIVSPYFWKPSYLYRYYFDFQRKGKNVQGCTFKEITFYFGFELFYWIQKINYYRQRFDLILCSTMFQMFFPNFHDFSLFFNGI